MMLFSQNDPRWKTKKLGFSNETIGNYGCLITAIGDMWDADPLVVNEWLKNNNGFLSLNLVSWTKLPGFIWRGWTYEDSKVKEAISKYGSCIIETDFNTNPKDGSHFVLAIGSGQIYDPWDGTKKPLNSYPTFYGYAIVNPMSNPIPPAEPVMPITIKERDFLIGRATTLKEFAIFLPVDGDPDKVSLDTLKKSISALRGRADSAESKTVAVEQQAENSKEQVSRLEKQLLEQDKLLKRLSERINKEVPEAKEIIDQLTTRNTALTKQVDEEAKAKGRALLDLAAEKASKDYSIIIRSNKLALIKYK